MKKSVTITLIIMMCTFLSRADSTYEIQINIKNYPGSSLLLTSYYGDKIILADTAFVGEPGEFSFSGDSLLPQGIYMAVSAEKKKLFEFIVGEDQRFTLSTDTANYVSNLSVSGSKENNIFSDYLKFNEALYRQNQGLREQLSESPKGSDQYQKLKNELELINQQSVNYKLGIIAQHPELLVSALFNAMREIDIPDSIQNTSDSLAGYRYLKSHYWDYFDLSDPRLLRTPLYSKKVNQYMEQLVVRHPDSAIAAIDLLIGKATPSDENISWLVWQFTAAYQNPEYMGFDVVFIHLVDVYFSGNNIENATPSILENLQQRADKMRPLILGSEAPNLILADTTGNYQSFFSLENDYVILYFWDYDCGICTKETAALKTYIDKSELDIGVFAVNVNADLDKWRIELRLKNTDWVNVNGTRSVTQNFHDLYDTYGTPAIFILDKDKKIIAKNISAEQISGFLEAHNKR